MSKETTFIINGKQRSTDEKELSYTEIINLAFDNPPYGANTCFTVEYRKGPNNQKEGSLTEGEEVKIKKGMIFNVTATDKS